MQMANTTTITGNLTREPEIRYTREGQATAQLGVAVNRRWQDRTTQEWQESTSFFDVICWRDLAENVALSLTKGMRVVVTGRLEHRTWETEEGEHRSKVEITADEVGASLRFATAEVHKVERRGSVSLENAEADAEANDGTPRGRSGCCGGRRGNRPRSDRRDAARAIASPVRAARAQSRSCRPTVGPGPPEPATR
jgi:single-strand DNA-binding protein